MNDISKDLLRYGKRDNSKPAEKAKAIIRANVLEAIGPDSAYVFDAFAGEGAMYRAVWKDAAGYVGCDKQWYSEDPRAAFVCDNRRALRAVDLMPYTVFDLDAHGSPWEQLAIIAARRPLSVGERVGVVMTEGLGLKMNMGGLSYAMAKLPGVKTRMPGMGAARDQLIERALRRVCIMMHASIERRWQAQGNKGSRVSYIGLVLSATEC
jgi:hypothetical protein